MLLCCCASYCLGFYFSKTQLTFHRNEQAQEPVVTPGKEKEVATARTQSLLWVPVRYELRTSGQEAGKIQDMCEIPLTSDRNPTFTILSKFCRDKSRVQKQIPTGPRAFDLLEEVDRRLTVIW